MSLKELLAEPQPVPCKICGLPSHGMHFGVVTCRPCAAFFRRFVVLKLNYACLQDRERCSLNNIRRSSCRHCRFQKCLQMGMSAENVQLNREGNTALNLSKKQDPKSEPEMIIQCQAEPSTSLMPVIKLEDQLYTKSILSEIRYDNLWKDMNEIFSSGIPSTKHGHFATLSPLYRFVEGLKLVRKPQQTERIKFENRLSMNTLVPHWRAQARHTAILSMHSMAFRNIKSMADKTMIYKAVWRNIYRFERIQMSTEIFGGKCVSEKKLAISCEKAIQLDALFFDLEGVAQEKVKLSLQDYKAFAERCVEEVAKPLNELCPSIEEVAFLILNFVLHNEDTIKGEALEVCDEFRDNIADDLHKYYQDNEILNYAQRVAKMMSIIIAMKKIHYEDLGGGFIVNTRNSENQVVEMPTGCVYE
ncbi:hypothetical protein L3Y34_009375 [Caenorhabditis briggsae]|nr:hypothetical protein L3Y34_009375 [Caenorhabditis briggsae]